MVIFKEGQGAGPVSGAMPAGEIVRWVQSVTPGPSARLPLKREATAFAAGAALAGRLVLEQVSFQLVSDISVA